MNDFDALLLAVLFVIALGAVLVKAGLLKIELKQPTQRQPRRTFGEPPDVTGGQS